MPASSALFVCRLRQTACSPISRRALGAAAAAAGLGGGAPAWSAHPLLLAVGVVFASRAQKHAILILGARTRLWLHLPLHACMLALAQRHVPGLCRVLEAEAGPAGQGPAAVQALASCFTTLSSLSLLYLLPLPAPLLASSPGRSALSQCRAVVSMLQVRGGGKRAGVAGWGWGAAGADFFYGRRASMVVPHCAGTRPAAAQCSGS